MQKKLRIFPVLFLIILLAFMGVVVASKIQKTLAAQAGDQDNVDMYVYVDGRLSNSDSWANFSGDYVPGNQSITANPGDTVNFRVRVWNSGVLGASQADISGDVTNPGYVSDLTIADSDMDGDSESFNGFSFTGGGDGTVDTVSAAGTPSNGYQGLTGTITLGNNFPVGQTVITGTVTISDYNPGLIAINPILKPFLIDKAHAEGVDRNSTLRIVVNVLPEAQAEETQEETQTESVVTETTATDLPDTGKDSYSLFFRELLSDFF